MSFHLLLQLHGIHSHEYLDLHLSYDLDTSKLIGMALPLKPLF